MLFNDFISLAVGGVRDVERIPRAVQRVLVDDLRVKNELEIVLIVEPVESGDAPERLP